MIGSITLGALAVTVVGAGANAFVKGGFFGDDGGVAGSIGGDIALCTVPTATTYQPAGDTHAFAFAAIHWNAGDEALLWQTSTTQHPVFAQNMYRIKDGRLEMIGMAWLRHGFCALQSGGCGVCDPCGGACAQCLGPGCSDVHSASFNGMQSNLGPRSEVNASTGEFLYPWTIGWGESGNSVFKRIQVADVDLDPVLNESAVYLLEGHYVHPDEGTSDRRHNNASYRRVAVTETTVSGAETYALLMQQPTAQMQPAIFAWQEHHPDVLISPIDIPGEPVDGRYYLGFKVTDNGDGTWRYDYALQNLNSHRSAQAFTVPLPPGVNILDTHYHDVKYHSGEPYTNEDWTLNITSDSISWEGVPYDVNPNANAIRWSSTFTFGFTADAPPVKDDVTIDLFRPGTPDGVLALSLVPGDVVAPCPGDLTGNGSVGVPDLLALLGCWGDTAPGCEDADLTGSGSIGVPDLLELLANWGDCE